MRLELVACALMACAEPDEQPPLEPEETALEAIYANAFMPRADIDMPACTLLFRGSEHEFFFRRSGRMCTLPIGQRATVWFTRWMDGDQLVLDVDRLVLH